MISSNKPPGEGNVQVSRSLKRYRTPVPVLVMSLAAVLVGCAQARAPAPEVVTSSKVTRLDVDAKSLLIQGYNYTDDYINSFTVDGQGGGNLYVSGPTSGGGKSVCCASFSQGMPLPIKLKVRWTGAYCMEYETNMFGRTSAYRKGLWRESEALAVDLSQGKPRALEVHIFPDGHVEAAITQGYSRPRLVLPDDHRGLRPGVHHTYPDCTDDQLKQATQ